MENWRQVVIEPFTPFYEVSNLGRIRKNKEKIIAQFKKNKVGYWMVTLTTAGAKKNFYTHKLVALAFVDGFKDGLVVDHINSDKFDNKPDNLEWITQEENNRRQVKNGCGIFFGIDNFNYKLNPDKVISLRKSGMTFTDIGNQLGTSYVAVRECLKRSGFYYPTDKCPQLIKSEAIEMREGGRTHREIAEHFGCSRTAVRNLLRKNGLS